MYTRQAADFCGAGCQRLRDCRPRMQHRDADGEGGQSERAKLMPEPTAVAHEAGLHTPLHADRFQTLLFFPSLPFVRIVEHET